MTIDSKFIEHWGPKYDEIESDESEYLSLIKRVEEETIALSSISRATFERIINWKSPRVKGFIKWENYGIYRDAFQNILDPKNPDKMVAAAYTPGPMTACLILEGAAAYLECNVVDMLDVGDDHDIVIGEVVNAAGIEPGEAGKMLTLPDLGWSYEG